MGNTTTKQITFPIELLKVLEPKAKRYGFTFPAYVRYVLTKEMEKEFEKKNNIFIDQSLINEILEGKKESKDGKLITLKSRKEIEDHFTALVNEEE